jgi:peptidoglycan hydrolase FlgJ
MDLARPMTPPPAGPAGPAGPSRPAGLTTVGAPATATAARDAARPSAAQLQQAGEGFEALFLSLLLKSGRAGLPGDDLTGSAAVTSTYEMLDAQLARDGASRAGLGIADAVVRQFSGTGTGAGTGTAGGGRR